jgi:predicted O-methyltransferase YrrM
MSPLRWLSDAAHPILRWLGPKAVWERREYQRLHGGVEPLLWRPFSYVRDRRLGSVGQYVWHSRQIHGWTRDDEAIRLAQVSQSLPNNAIVVEIGAFLGCSTVLLAGGRKTRGSGEVHAVDPFDASGDAFSQPIYASIRETAEPSLRDRFEQNLTRAGVERWVSVHQMRDQDLVGCWSRPIDLLFLDGNHEYEAVLATYWAWSRFLKPGGILAVHNSRPGYRRATHDGSARLVEERVHAPAYGEIELVDSTTFARKVTDDRP